VIAPHWRLISSEKLRHRTQNASKHRYTYQTTLCAAVVFACRVFVDFSRLPDILRPW
jgi:hypothetical protein